MAISHYNERIHLFLTGILAFLIPVYPDALPVAIGLLTLNWLFAPKRIKEGFKNILHPITLSLIALYVLYLLGLTYSNNIPSGLESLETKFSFLLLPFIFSAYPQHLKNNFNNYLKLFIYGCTTNALMCLVWAAYCYIKPVYVDLYGTLYDLGFDNFYYAQLSKFFHPSYIAMYCVFALFSITHLADKQELEVGIKEGAWKWLLIIIMLTLYVLLLSSKAGWIGLFGFAVYFFIRSVRARKILNGFLLLAFTGIAFYFLNINYTQRFSTRIPKLSVVTQTIKGSDDNNNKITTGTDGTGSRILVWKAAIDIIKENIFTGVGTGDAKDKMLVTYQKRGMILEYEHKLNSHNQFLNTFIALGITGFLALLFCLLIPLYYSIKGSYFLFSVFVLLCGFNFLFESMLERQAGVIYFAFFFSLLYFNLQQSKKLQ